MGVQMTFKRHELNYMLTHKQVSLLKEAIALSIKCSCNSGMTSWMG